MLEIVRNTRLNGLNHDNSLIDIHSITKCRVKCIRRYEAEFL